MNIFELVLNMCWFGEAILVFLNMISHRKQEKKKPFSHIFSYTFQVTIEHILVFLTAYA